MSYNYSKIDNFGSNAVSEVDNPLTYCVNNTLDQRFLHGSGANELGQHSRPCQLFMSEYCAQGWDKFCDLAAANQVKSWPNDVGPCGTRLPCLDLTAGDTLVRNTATRKYLVKMIGGHLEFQPFDPNVASSPLISQWKSDVQCNAYMQPVPVYGVEPKDIDNDPVMTRLLAKPQIAMDVLMGIFKTMKNNGTLSQLKGTRLGTFYSNNPQIFK
jgi:hypothetical protein